jgi:hypothetical protein
MKGHLPRASHRHRGVKDLEQGEPAVDAGITGLPGVDPQHLALEAFAHAEIRKQLGADQPGPGNRAASAAAWKRWEADPCYKRVAALRFRIAAGPLYDKLPDIYDDVMSGRKPNIKN